MVTLKWKQMHLPPDYFLLIYNVTRNCIFFFCKYCFYFFGTFLCLWCLGRRKSLEQGAFLNAGGQGFSAYTFFEIRQAFIGIYFSLNIRRRSAPVYLHYRHFGISGPLSKLLTRICIGRKQFNDKMLLSLRHYNEARGRRRCRQVGRSVHAV